ncbi:carbonic anhydrase [Specibacter cremeus]|uniref:carbonic anhydrase n=1 Tax=Specibacter cremeus TaxID=1629051 RepID=UPI000F7781ED|nr:carbonic anhydrase [Specibacter cremeus]
MPDAEDGNIHAISDHPLTPAQAWVRLMEGNQRFVASAASHPNQDASRRTSLLTTQHPFALIFGCSDSRLAAEIIFDLGLGDAFVIRTAGHVIDNTVLGSLEYGVEYLDVPLIVVLGHDSCGAVTATRDAVATGEMPGGFVRDLVEKVTPSVLTALRRDQDSTLDDMIEEHVRETAARLVENSPIIANAVTRQRTAVVGLTYHLDEGRAELVYSNGALTVGL